LITVVHAGIDIGLPDPVHCTPKMARRVIDEVHPNHLVLAHMGGWKLWDDVEDLLVGQQVFFDTASTDTYISEEQFVRMVKNHGAEKILFGTDSPWSGQKETIAMIQKLSLTADEKEKILGVNAVHLLGMC
jgi:predicted TIM-barrel fold metal-dependent hydrolase